MNQSELIRESLQLLSSSPVECLSQVLAKICQSIVKCQQGVILIVNNQTNTMALDVLYGYPVEDVLRFRNERKVFGIDDSKLVSIDALKAGTTIIRPGEQSDHYYAVTKGIKKTLSHPVKHGGEWVAVLTLESKDDSAFEEYEREVNEGTAPAIIDLCGNLVAAAVNTRQSFVYKFDKFIKHSNLHDSDKLGLEVVQWVSETFNVNTCAIYFNEYMFEEGKYPLVCKASKINGELAPKLAGETYEGGEGYTGWINAHHHSLFLPEFENEESAALDNYHRMFDERPTRSGRLREHFPRLSFKSYLGVPLISGNRNLGVLEILDTRREYAFSDEALLETIGNRVAEEFLRISRDKRRENMFVIPNIQTGDLQKVIRGVVDTAMKLAEATHGFFMYKEGDGRFYPRAVKGHGLSKKEIPHVEPDQDNLVTAVMKEPYSALQCPDITDKELGAKLEPRLSRTFLPKGIKSLLMVPVYLNVADTGEKEHLGVLGLMSFTPNAFQEDEFVITALAEIVSYHIWGSRVLHELANEKAHVLRMEQDLAIYNRIVSAAATSAGTVHTAKKHIREIKSRIDKLYLNPTIREHRDLLELVGPAHKGMDELNDLYDRLHDVFAGIEAKPESCDLAALLQEARTYMQPSFKERRVTFTSSVKSGSIRLQADVLLMKVAFINLIRNSMEAGAREIKVRAKYITLLIRDYDRKAVEITFEDNGTGISEGEWERIFDPFVTYNKKGGTGLGLAVNRDILAKHDGDIKVTSSTTGVGTVITLTLPLPHSDGLNGQTLTR